MNRFSQIVHRHREVSTRPIYIVVEARPMLRTERVDSICNFRVGEDIPCSDVVKHILVFSVVGGSLATGLSAWRMISASSGERSSSRAAIRWLTVTSTYSLAYSRRQRARGGRGARCRRRFFVLIATGNSSDESRRNRLCFTIRRESERDSASYSDGRWSRVFSTTPAASSFWT